MEDIGNISYGYVLHPVVTVGGDMVAVKIAEVVEGGTIVVTSSTRGR